MSGFIRPIDVLAAHRYDEGPVQDCACGWLAAEATWTNIGAAHAAHVLEAFAAQRMTVVEEPKSDHGKHPWWRFKLGEVEAFAGGVALYIGNGSYRFDPVDARAAAAALLAAAAATDAALLTAADAADRAGDDREGR